MPYAIDYDPATGNARELSADAPLPAGWTRLLASDYAHLDQWEDVPAVYSTPPPVMSTPEPVVVTPASRRLVRAGVCFEYDRRRDEIVAGRPVPVKMYSKDEYISAVQAVLDREAKVHGYDDIVSACSYAGAPNFYQSEGIAFVKWRGDMWAAALAAQSGAAPAIPPTPEQFAEAILSAVPAP